MASERKPKLSQLPEPPEPTEPFGERFHVCYVCADRSGTPWCGLRKDHDFQHDQAPKSLG